MTFRAFMVIVLSFASGFNAPLAFFGHDTSAQCGYLALTATMLVCAILEAGRLR